MAKKRASGQESSTPKKAGRPKAGGKIGFRFSVVASPEYRVWMSEFQKIFGEGTEVSDVIRLAIRRLAESRGFREPPKM